MEFYKILLEIMDEKSLKIPDVARLTGLSDSTIRSIIARKTKNITLEVAFKMSKGLGVSLERLNGENSFPLENVSPGSESLLLENYNKLNDLGKDKLIEYSNDLTETPKYIEINNSNNVTELITATKECEEFKPLTSFDSFTTVAAHYDELTDEEKAEADRRILEHLNKIKLEEFNSKKKS
ncbi:helix-turn-helix domain-containing protein [Clostridium beijerinckii]|uniref:helix-turn-helix domain-containing protein n=1 Tax=Clostridium beijerinckii TaxID=1520 RepID=UPI0009C8DC6D|nr:helix-turn-helix transcriptional regulator [Clostridium beijerinckii]NRT76358.1 plasmid maintenance system antidote protein VapI [Clostridium beijerinckii]OOM48606.1 helix-turn-helix protein [Clostridium beijerinckii]